MQKFSRPAAAILLAAVVVTPALGQTPAAPAARPPAAQTPPPAAPPAAATPRPAAPRPRPTTPVAQIVVRDNSGTGLDGVKIAVTGPTNHQATTDAKGISTVTLPAGAYRFRFERADYVTLERDVTIQAVSRLKSPSRSIRSAASGAGCAPARLRRRHPKRPSQRSAVERVDPAVSRRLHRTGSAEGIRPRLHRRRHHAIAAAARLAGVTYPRRSR